MPPLIRCAPEYVLWELTTACNLRCRHCLTSSGVAHVDELTTAEAEVVGEQLVEMGVPAVALMGGEPLMRADWESVAKRLARGGIAPALVTNGILFDRPMAERARGAGVSQVVVSLDGGRRGHEAIRGRGTFAKAVRAIRIASEVGIPNRMVMTTVNRGNLGELEAILSTLRECGAGAVWALNLTSIRKGLRMGVEQRLDAGGFLRVAKFIDQARRDCKGLLHVMGAHDIGYYSARYPDVQGGGWQGCRAGLSTMGITARGLVKGCLALADDRIEGSVRKRGLAQIWGDPDLFAYTRRFHPSELGARCRSCAHGSECRGGCLEVSWTMAGRPHAAPFCLHRWEREGEP